MGFEWGPCVRSFLHTTENGCHHDNVGSLFITDNTELGLATQYRKKVQFGMFKAIRKICSNVGSFSDDKEGKDDLLRRRFKRINLSCQ